MIEKNILFVDDEISVLSSIKRQFRKADFRLITAQGGEEALRILADKTEIIQVIISDEKMPHMSGISLLQEVKKRYPDVVRIILSGYADTNSIIDSINKGEVFRFVTKPWTKESLTEVINQAYTQIESTNQNKKIMELIVKENKELHLNLSQRDNGLQLSHEILELIPSPLLAISHNGTIYILNREASLMLGFTCEGGDSLNTLFPEPLVEKILNIKHDFEKKSSFIWEHNNNVYKLIIRIMRPTDPLKELIIFEKQNLSS